MSLVLPLCVLLLAVCILSLVIYTRAGFNRAVAEVETKLRDAQHIVETGEMPPAWAHSEKAGEERDCALERLDSLIEYFQVSRSVSDEETRELLLLRLRNARHEWVENDVLGAKRIP